MPIKFRCPQCRQFLGISPAKAGELTDCPACGRTVRVPNLDGTVTPLPAARIDHRDAQLAEALSALSQIGVAPTTETVGPAQRTPHMAPAPAAAVTAAPAPRPVAVAVPQPLSAERVVPGATPPATPRSLELSPELLFDLETPDAIPSRRTRRKQVPAGAWIAAAALVAAAVFLAGLLTGRALERRSGDLRASATALPGGAAAIPRAAMAVRGSAADQPPPATVGISGTVMYPTPDGESRTDGGARVIVLPAQRPETPPLAVSGFRAGAVPTDRERAVTAIRAMGGDYAIADASGRYALDVSAGPYEVLFLSRHLARDDTQPVDASITALLAGYFDQPAGLIGSVAIESESIEFDGAPLRLDHAFSR